MATRYEPPETTIGFVGLGIMGEPMARNLLAAGYPLRAHNRSREPVERLAGHGAVAAASPAEAARGAQVVITVLADAPDVEEVVAGPSGVADGLTEGGVVIDMSTIQPAAARRLAAELAERGLSMLDAPVSGGQRGAVEGTLSIMVGGDADAVAACRPVFEVLGASVTHIGGAGAGQIAKACNQVVVAGTIQAVAEALTLAERSGVDPAAVRSALLGGFAGSKILQVHGQRMLDRDFEPGFKVRLHDKDLRIALEAADDAGFQLPAAALVKQLLASLAAQGYGDADHSALARLVDQLSGQNAE
jgi:2-hydroxy-3-oxopropionate reductase